MVWIAGPLSGLIVQPIIGVLSDGATSRWGRRRPFIAVGSVIVALGLVTLGFTREIVGAFISDPATVKIASIVVAVLSLYATDFAINAVMSCSRSLLVDTLPVSKQQDGAAWSSRMGSIGHISGYGLGAVDLVGMLGTTLGDTQFKILSLIAAAGMLGSSAITCWAVTERVLVSVRQDPRNPKRRFKVFHQIWSTLLNLSPRIQAICWAIFWSWIGWYPFLVYSSTWVGETFFRYDVPADAQSSEDALGDMGRVGSTALTVYSIVVFLGAWLMPLFVRSPEDEGFTPRPPQSIARWVETINKVKPDLLTVWIGSNFVFSAAMFLAPFATSFRFATVLVGLCGL
jgi:solute carrier family 45, member 1/2/4